MREKDGKYYAAGGTKGYRWLEAEMVKTLGKEADIDRSYYDNMVDNAVMDISQYGDFEWFVSDDLYIPKVKEDYAAKVPCGDNKYLTCFDCPHYYEDKFHADCQHGYDISSVVLNSKEKGE